MIAFLERIFRGTGVADRQQEFNYYFALKAQLLDMEKVHISQKFYERGRGYSLDIGDEQIDSTPHKAPSKRKTTALDTLMVVDKVKITKF